MAGSSDAVERGRSVLQGLKISVHSTVADLLRRDATLLEDAVEMGLVSRDWLERPGEAPVSEATPIEVVHRFLERTVEQRPSSLAALGLSAIEVLSSESENIGGVDGTSSELAVAFTDLEGFTRYTATVGDDAARVLLVEHRKAVGPVVRSSSGRIVKRLGDGLLLTFPSPSHAVRACLDLVAAEPEPLRLRAGVHWGGVVATGGDVVGHAVNIAARVAGVTGGNEVLVTDAVRSAAAPLAGIDFTRPHRRRFKGVDETVLVWRAVR